MNRPIFDLHGRHVGTPDLLDAEAGLYGEYDSERTTSTARAGSKDLAPRGRVQAPGTRSRS